MTDLQDKITEINNFIQEYVSAEKEKLASAYIAIIRSQEREIEGLRAAIAQSALDFERVRGLNIDLRLVMELAINDLRDSNIARPLIISRLIQALGELK